MLYHDTAQVSSTFFTGENTKIHEDEFMVD